MTIQFSSQTPLPAIPLGVGPDFQKTITFAHEVVQALAYNGVLINESIVSHGLRRLIDYWAVKPVMQAFIPTLTHGDVTPSNFIFPLDSGLVVVDWEFLHVQDPAIDLGYLMAKMIHNLKRYGGQAAEAIPFIEHLVHTYRQSLPSRQDHAAPRIGQCFYQALTQPSSDCA